MKYLVICDYRENMRNYASPDNDLFNDHASSKNISEIITGIQKLGYECEYFGGIPELLQAVNQQKTFKDCMFLNFTDGMEQNYGRVQAPVLLDILNVPYSGSGVFSSVLMNNKHFCKNALVDCDVLLPKSCIVNSFIPLNKKKISEWEYPLFVKPNCEGSSLGISAESVCHTMSDVVTAVHRLLTDFGEVIVEEYVPGVDITNYLIGNGNNYYVNDVITSELFDKSPFAVYDSVAKHNKLRTLYFNEEKIPVDILKKIQTTSLEIARTIGVKDICRIDYRFDVITHKFTFIEINSAPRFSSTSEVGFIAQKRNITFSKMLHYLLMSFLERQHAS